MTVGPWSDLVPAGLYEETPPVDIILPWSDLVPAGLYDEGGGGTPLDVVLPWSDFATALSLTNFPKTRLRKVGGNWVEMETFIR